MWRSGESAQMDLPINSGHEWSKSQAKWLIGMSFHTNNANNNSHTYNLCEFVEIAKVFILTAQVTSQNNLDWIARLRLQNIVWLGHWTIKQIAPTRTINKLSLTLYFRHKQTHTHTHVRNDNVLKWNLRLFGFRPIHSLNGFLLLETSLTSIRSLNFFNGSSPFSISLQGKSFDFLTNPTSKRFQVWRTLMNF